MEMCTGDWTYEGAAHASPFGPAGSFKGKAVARMILGGFFLENREDDKNEDGYVYQGVQIRGFDSVTKGYVEHAYENDGTVTSAVVTVNGNRWTSTGTRKDGHGKQYMIRHASTYAPDGQSSTFKAEYSADEGKTWLAMWEGTMKRVQK
jgi:hypothetical protein